MGLETGTYISDLNASNPIHATDPVSQGDDHIRLIKSVLLATFPNVNGAVNFTPTEANLLDGLTGVTGSGNLVASASPTFTGDVTVNTIGGIASANLVDKSASETISGATWDFQAITAVSFGGIASGNLVDKSAAETISGNWTFSGTVALNGTVTGLSTADLSDGSSVAILSDNETVTGAWNFSGNLTASDDFITSGTLSTASTGNIDSLNVTGYSIVRFTGGAIVNLRGMTGGVAGKRITVINLTSNAMQIFNENTTPSAANRIRVAATTSTSMSVNDACDFIYDGVSSRWQAVGI